MGNSGALPVISIQALKRMPSYLHYLKQLHSQGIETISAAKAAQHFEFSEIQVRKDFSSISATAGRPKSGFSVAGLIDSVELYLGFRNVNEAVLVGVGSLGHALLSYPGFDRYGLKIIAAFDIDPEKSEDAVSGVPVLGVDHISDFCRRTKVHIGIITVPSEQAQLVCDQLVAGGIRAIWNFAQAHLSAPQEVLVQNENMAGSLAVLVSRLKNALQEEEER